MSLRENLISSDSMTLSAKANFNVIKRPVYFEKMIGEETKMQQIPKKYALIRDDNKECLGVVSPRYNVRNYNDLVSKVNTAMIEANGGNLTEHITVNDWTNPSGSKFKRDVYFWDKGIPVKDNYAGENSTPPKNLRKLRFNVGRTNNIWICVRIVHEWHGKTYLVIQCIQ
jgi:hypothetical protein